MDGSSVEIVDGRFVGMKLGSLSGTDDGFEKGVNDGRSVGN